MSRTRWTFSGLLALALGVFLPAAQASGLVLASDMEGQVTLHGKPVAGAQVQRHIRWHWNDEEAFQTVSTDAAGRFRLESVKGSSLLARVLPHEPVIAQLVTVRLNDVEYRLWQHTKHNYDANGEADRALRLSCELSDPDEYRVLNDLLKTGYKGVCRLL